MNATTTNTTSSSGKEVIHVAIGNTSCRISTHLHHLQGLACTSSSSSSIYSNHDTNNNNSNQAYCLGPVTHSTYQNVHFVPRTVLIGNCRRSDGGSCSNDSSRSTSNHVPSTESKTSSTTTTTTTTTPIFPTWSGTIETILRGPVSGSSNLCHFDTSVHPLLLPIEAEQRQQQQQLAYGPYSRYRQEPSQQQQQSRPTYATSHGRHVDWDHEMDQDDNDGYDDDEEETERMQRERERQRGSQQNQIAQEAMDEYWRYHHQPNHQQYPKNDSSPDTTNSPAPTAEPLLSWYDYLTYSTAPYHPTTTCIDIAQSPIFQKQFRCHDNGDANVPSPTLNEQEDSSPFSYYYPAFQADSQRYVERTLWDEHIRILLEECDSCQGLCLLQDHCHQGGGIYTGWGTQLLQLWDEECPHSVQCTMLIDDDNAQHHATTNNISESTNTKLSPVQKSPKHHTVRDQIQQSIILSDQTALSTVFLPLQLPPTTTTTSHAAAAAVVAMALECSSLPYRINQQDGPGDTTKSQLALQSYYYSGGNHAYGRNNYGTIPTLSFREYTRTLQRQSASRNVLELDTLSPLWNTNESSINSSSSLLQSLQQGTSLDRDQRMKQSGYRGGIHRSVDVLPGQWMNRFNSGNNTDGILSSLSPTTTTSNDKNKDIYDRSLHYHYALSTSLRPPPSRTCGRSNPSTSRIISTPTTSNYVSYIMESMGIRYQPEQTICTVLDQSYDELIASDAGSYWKYIFPTYTNGKDESKTSLSSIPIGMSVIGNTSRIYPYLVETACNSQQIIAPRNKRSIERSIYTRDATQGLLPEMDDCLEAITACLDIKDSYEPPQGSGLVLDEEGDYFDMS
jgi:hypothetical protein